jgi:hypothetical protein
MWKQESTFCKKEGSQLTRKSKIFQFIHNSAAIPRLDVFSTGRKENIFTDVLETQTTQIHSCVSALNDTLFVREPCPTDLLANLNGFNPTIENSYTVIYREAIKLSRQFLLLLTINDDKPI